MDEHEEDISIEAEDADTEAKAEGKIAKMRAELTACRKEKQENLDGWQRAKADYVNALKRFTEEKKAEHERGTVKAAEVLLPAFDALERAKEHGDIPPGFAGIVKQMESGFATLGLVAFGEEGEPFDPALHDALGQDAAESQEADDTLSAVLEKGWKIGDNVIRAAKVRVYHTTQ